MSRHRGKHKKSLVLEYRRQSAEDLRRQIEQARQQGDVRAALDMAKECHRREPTDAHARLLGDLHVERARQLMAKSLYAEAAIVLSHALALRCGNEDLLWLVFECGLYSRQYGSALEAFKRLQGEEKQARARSLLAEEMVAGGEEAGRLCDSPIREDAARIRGAFAAFERGDEEAVASELKAVGLSSPCAGWKWVLLGLMAYAQNDEARARTCWSRTGFGPRVDRLMGLLRPVTDPNPSSQDSPPPQTRSRVMAALGNPRLEMLRQVKEALSRHDDPEALRLSRQLIATVGQQEREAYSLRLARVVVPLLDWSDLDTRSVERAFARIPEDPRLTRALALWYEPRDPASAVYLWQAYLRDSQAMSSIPARLKARASSMIWKRMGDLAERASPDDLDDAAEECGAAQVSPVKCYQNSLRYYPDDRDTHERLMGALLARGSNKLAERQAEEILNRWPGDVKSLVFLAKSCFERDAVRKALKYFDLARQAEPFNAKVREEMVTCLLFSARRRMEKGNLELARRDYEQAEALSSPGEGGASLYCKWAALEWRAGDVQRAESLFAKALAARSEALPVYYQMAIDAARAPAPRDVQERIGQLLVPLWEAEPTGAEAAELVTIAASHVGLGIRYPRQEEHHRALMRYLERACSQAAFAEDQFLLLCGHLGATFEWSLLEAYAEKASEQCPGNYYFPLYLGRAQLHRLRGRLPRKTRTLLGRAGEQAARAGDLETAAELGHVLDMADRSRRGRRRGPRMLAGLAEILGLPDPFDFPDDDEPPRPRRLPRGAQYPGQMRLFDDLPEVRMEDG